MAGMTTVPDISTSLAAADIVNAVLQAAVDVSNLYALCMPVDVPSLTGTVPIMTAGAGVTQDLEELEVSDIEGATFSYVAFDLKKDRVKLAVSDEAGFRSRVGDPLQIQIQDAAQQLAAVLDQKVINALETSPQTSATAGAWSTVTNNPLADLATAVAAIRPYKADFVIMPTAVWGKYIANDLFKNMVNAGEPAMEKAVGRIPGLALDVFVDTSGEQTLKTALVGASRFCAAYGKGPVVVNTERNNDLGATVYTLDVFRQVKAPLFLNASSLNKAAYVLTAVIA